MAKIKPIPIIIGGIVIIAALFVALIAYKKLQNKIKMPLNANVATQPIAVAALYVAPGTTLTKNMIKAVPFLKKSLPGGWSSDPSALEGRITVFPINADEPILESRLAPITIKTGGIAAVVSSKKRAMAVKVNPVTGLSGLIHPGNRVDVLVTVTKRQQGGEEEKSLGKIVLENILVLATGIELGAEKQEKPSPVEVVTLEVTPEEAEKLALACSTGNIHLALRNFIDSEDVITQGVTIPILLSSYGAVRKTSGIEGSAKPLNYTVQVIKGSAVT